MCRLKTLNIRRYRDYVTPNFPILGKESCEQI